MREEAGHEIDPRPIAADRAVELSQALPRGGVPHVVVELVKDRLLVGHAGRVDAPRDESRHPVCGEVHPVSAPQRVADLEQADALVECVVAAADIEGRIGEGDAVGPQRPHEPWLVGQDLRGADVDHRAPRGRVVVPRIDRSGGAPRVIALPVVQQELRSVQVASGACLRPGCRERPDVPKRVVVEQPVDLPERVLAPRRVCWQCDRRVPGEGVPVTEQAVRDRLRVRRAGAFLADRCRGRGARGGEHGHDHGEAGGQGDCPSGAERRRLPHRRPHVLTLAADRVSPKRLDGPYGRCDGPDRARAKVPRSIDPGGKHPLGSITAGSRTPR